MKSRDASRMSNNTHDSHDHSPLGKHSLHHDVEHAAAGAEGDNEVVQPPTASSSSSSTKHNLLATRDRFGVPVVDLCASGDDRDEAEQFVEMDDSEPDWDLPFRDAIFAHNANTEWSPNKALVGGAPSDTYTHTQDGTSSASFEAGLGTAVTISETVATSANKNREHAEPNRRKRTRFVGTVPLGGDSGTSQISHTVSQGSVHSRGSESLSCSPRETFQGDLAHLTHEKREQGRQSGDAVRRNLVQTDARHSTHSGQLMSNRVRDDGRVSSSLKLGLAHSSSSRLNNPVGHRHSSSPRRKRRKSMANTSPRTIRRTSSSLHGSPFRFGAADRTHESPKHSRKHVSVASSRKLPQGTRKTDDVIVIDSDSDNEKDLHALVKSKAGITRKFGHESTVVEPKTSPSAQKLAKNSNEHYVVASRESYSDESIEIVDPPLIGPEYQAKIMPQLRGSEREAYVRQARERDARNSRRASRDDLPSFDSADVEFEFTHLIAKRKVVDEDSGKKVTQYLVKWKGFPPSQCSWEYLPSTSKAVRAFNSRFRAELKPVPLPLPLQPTG